MIVAKLAVLPVSAIVTVGFGCDDGTKGGPSAALLVQDGSVVTLVFNLVVSLLGSPLPQVLVAGLSWAPRW